MIPKTLDELLALLPTIGRFRDLSADQLRALLGRERGECTWCGSLVKKPRRVWCSDACVEAFRLRCDSSYARSVVLKRDGGLCQSCGRNVEQAEAGFNEFSYRHIRSRGWQTVYATELRERFGYARGTVYEVDHIRPVVEGGGLCGPEGLRLLCGCCHATATATLAKQRAGGLRKLSLEQLP